MEPLKKISLTILKLAITLLALWTVAILIMYYINFKTFSIEMARVREVAFDDVVLFILGFEILLYIAWRLNKLMTEEPKDKPSSKPHSVKTKEGKEVEQYFNARWTTEKELLNKTKGFTKFIYSPFANLRNLNKDGILIRAKKKSSRNMDVTFYDPAHTIVIGTTGSGKTTMYVAPSIQILAKTKSKPSMVITDPKGELTEDHSEFLKQQGYDVKVIDLRNPNKSTRWNPLERPYNEWQRAHTLEKEVLVHSGGNPKRISNLKTIAGAKYGNEWYEFEGVAYPDKSALKGDLMGKQQELKNSALQDISDLCKTICPIEGQDPTWSRGAQKFIYGTLVAMLEDTLDERLGMTREKFTFYNLAKIVATKDRGSDNYVSLKEYFQGRPATSESKPNTDTVLYNATQTRASFMGNVTNAINSVSGDAIGYLTSGTDIDLSEFADKPSALFLKIPDETKTMDFMANIFITQLYKMLIDRANRESPKQLPRTVYFLLDEFGNLPKIEKLDSFITAGRSRKIFLSLVIQDYAQLDAIYGQGLAETIKNNCNVHIYIGTKDIKTREEFSKKVGSRPLHITKESKSKGKDSKSTSTSTDTVLSPLISSDELDHLKLGEVVVNVFNEFAIRSEITPTYKAKEFYKKIPMPGHYVPIKHLDSEKIFYDIKKRNNTVLRSHDKNDDDDDTGNFDFFRR